MNTTKLKSLQAQKSYLCRIALLYNVDSLYFTIVDVKISILEKYMTKSPVF